MSEIPLSWINEANSLSDNELEAYIDSKCSGNLEMKSIFYEIINPGVYQIPTPKTNANSCHGIFRKYLDKTREVFKEKNIPDWERSLEHIEGSINSTFRRLALRKPTDRNAGYGLIIGRIQSGKTAHLIGLSLKLMDSDETEKPFDTVIVLSGLIDDLRKQTYSRFYKSITVFQNNITLIPGRDNDIGIDSNEELDKIANHFTSESVNPEIIVIKKFHSVLETILGHLQPLRNQIKNRRILIIDDEADHASIDTNQEEEEIESENDIPSKTNRLVRQLILLASRGNFVWYLGYTATPYANLLIHPEVGENDESYGYYLFPRDIIHCLNRPPNHLDNQVYFGTANCGNLRLIDPNINDIEESNKVSEMIVRHILSNEIKRIRNINDHHTTLVHTSLRQVEHEGLAYKFIERLEYFLEKAHKNDFYLESLNIINSEFGNLAELPALRDKIEDWNGQGYLDLFDKLDRIEIIESNDRTRGAEETHGKDVNYEFGKKSYIVVGGTRLSRGLTLEGLTNSWFTRIAMTEPKYDTMLQMSRWCGYRTGYDDLVRIFTTLEIREAFQVITEAETDLRQRLIHLPENTDPLSIEPWIREHPGFSITSEEKMVDIVRRYWGGYYDPIIWSYETPYFDNTTAASELLGSFTSLIKSINTSNFHNSTKEGGTFLLARDVPNLLVRKFVTQYYDRYLDNDPSLTSQRLRQIIPNWPAVTHWNIAIKNPRGKPRSHNIDGMNIRLGNRKSNGENRFSIVQNGPNDIHVDLVNGEERSTPLLLIYLIDNESQNSETGERVFPSHVNNPIPFIGIILSTSMIPREGGVEVMHGGRVRNGEEND